MNLSGRNTITWLLGSGDKMDPNYKIAQFTKANEENEEKHG